jgi:glycosyltransferase involved in cell wall biosynthesis
VSALSRDPLCTIAIPVYHRMEKALAFAAIESALAEARTDIEILVIDDHTTDGTWDRLIDVVGDRPARLLRNDRNLGLFQNFNRCLDEARGQYVRILCSDDMLEPGSLGDELTVMERHHDMALLTTHGVRIAPDGRALGLQAAALPEGYYRGERGIAAVLRSNAGTGYNALNYPSGVLLRKTAADAAGRFRTDMRVSGDVEYFLRVLQHGALGVLHRVGCRITVHPDQVGSRLALEPLAMRELFTLIDEFRPILRGHASEAEVRRATAALSVWQALRLVVRGGVHGALAHFDVARRHGAGGPEMLSGFARLLARRARWAVQGPFGPLGVVPDHPL